VGSKLDSLMHLWTHTLSLIMTDQPAKPWDVLGVTAASVILIWGLVKLVKMIG
jgi:hypothetical protein